MNVSLRKALNIPCKCGGMPKVRDGLENGEHWLLYCDKCGAESLSGCRRHYATNSWAAMNNTAPEGGK